MSRNVHRTEDAPTEVTLPITPMLDMAFQLLFFFLCTFNPVNKREGQLDLSLPAKSATAAADPKKADEKAESHKEEIDIPAELTIKLRSHEDIGNRGSLSAMIVSTPAGESTLGGTVEEKKKKLADKLEATKPRADAAKDGKKKVPTVRIEAASALRWEEVVKVMDVCYRAGYQVSFVKPPDFGLTGQ
jgi:biopolymer transport protein ExbD